MIVKGIGEEMEKLQADLHPDIRREVLENIGRYANLLRGDMTETEAAYVVSNCQGFLSALTTGTDDLADAVGRLLWKNLMGLSKRPPDQELGPETILDSLENLAPLEIVDLSMAKGRWAKVEGVDWLGLVGLDSAEFCEESWKGKVLTHISSSLTVRPVIKRQ